MPATDDGDGQFGVLEDAWASVLEHWHDDMAREFDAGYWTPLRHEYRFYVEALRRLTEVLDAADRETGD